MPVIGNGIYILRALTHKERKQNIRSKILAIRDKIDPEDHSKAALAACEHSRNIPAKTGGVIGFYWPIRSEFDTRPLMQNFAARGARIALPAVIDQVKIEFREYTHDDHLKPSGFGTYAPCEGKMVLFPSILIMPLSAIDSCGNRIGYGAGHYDRYISNRAQTDHNIKLIGLGFECQIVDEVPCEVHDQRLHGLLTENGYRTFS